MNGVWESWPPVFWSSAPGLLRRQPPRRSPMPHGAATSPRCVRCSSRARTRTPPTGTACRRLHWAAERGDVEVVEVLVHAGAAVDAATRIGHYTPLHVASTVGQTAVIERLIKAGADVTAATSTSGVTPLHLAAASGSPAAVAALLDHGADVDAREGAWGQTPLIFAAARDRVDVVRTLLERGADPAVTSSTVNLVADGRLAGEARRRQRSVLAAFESGDATATPSQVQAAVLAARDHYLSSEAPEVEANNGRPPAIETKGGLTALLHAARQGYIGAATALLDGGADIDQAGAGDGTSPLLMATINAQFDLARVLIERGADPNLAASLNGMTPLWAAVNAEWQPRTRFPQPQQHGFQQATYLDVMEALLVAGADPNARLTRHPWYMVYSGCGNRNCGLVGHRGVDRVLARGVCDRPAGAAPCWSSTAPTRTCPPWRRRAAVGAAPRLRTTTTRTCSRRCRRRPVCGWPRIRGRWVPMRRACRRTKRAIPGVYPIHAASGVGYGEGFAGNAHRHAPDAWLATVTVSGRAGRRREPARSQRLQRHPPCRRARGRRAHPLPGRAGWRRYRREPARPDDGRHGQRSGPARVAHPRDGGAARAPRLEEQPQLRDLLSRGSQA